ncbi:MAG: hypothetical protein HN576_01680 [Bacteriovoracaceae bacterium]|nr:hypothetical protein [Bacteriovoracaceae bacterium]
MKKMFIVLTSFAFANMAFGANIVTKKNKRHEIRYKKSKTVDFESLLIQGERKRADIVVVTGDVDDDLGGLLRLRENFIDHQSQDFGEVVE